MKSTRENSDRGRVDSVSVDGWSDGASFARANLSKWATSMQGGKIQATYPCRAIVSSYT